MKFGICSKHRLLKHFDGRNSGDSYCSRDIHNLKILFLGYHSRILKYFDDGYPRNSEDSYSTLDILKKIL